MKQIIRLPGLLGFAAVIGLLSAFFIFFSGSLLKMGIEYGGSKMVGAKVELDSVDLSFSPLGFKLNNLQVTNAKKPMENLIQIENTQANLELGPLFQSKFMMSDLNVKGMRFNTQRKTSGEIKDKSSTKKPKQSSKEKIAKVAKKLPSADEMLAREPLKTIKAGEELKQSYETRMAEVNKAIDSLPKASKTDEYQKRVEALLNEPINSIDEFKQRKAQLDSLKKDIKADKQAMVSAKEILDTAQKELRDKFNNLQQSPNADYRHLLSKYSLDAQGMAEMTGLLFGPQFGNYAKQGLYWYQRLRPYLASATKSSGEKKEQSPARLVGRYVHFPTNNPWVSFLIRKGNLSASVPQGELAINLKDISNEQAILQRSSKINISGKNLKKIDHINANLDLDYRKNPGKEALVMDFKNWRLGKLDLGAGGVGLASARVSTRINAVVVNQEIDSTLRSVFASTQFTSKGDTLVARELGAALKEIKSFNVNATAKGDIDSPDVSLSSNLEQQVGDAVNARLNAKKKQLERELKAKLEKKMLEYAGPYGDKIKQLDLTQGDLSNKLAKLEKMATAELEDFAKQQERKLKAEAEAKRKELEDKAKAEEERLKKEAEAKRKAEEEKLKAEQERLKREAEAKRKAEEEKLKKQAEDKLKSFF